MATINKNIKNTTCKMNKIKQAAIEAKEAVDEVIAAMKEATALFEKLKSYCPTELNKTVE